jgi:glutamyl-tRNA synthetase
MILGSDKSRLSKRHGATSVMAYREMGYLPEALVNYLARLGWSHGDQEIFSLEEMVGAFSLKHVGKAAAVFNPDKLDWLNAHYIKNTSDEKLAELAWPFMEKRGFARPDWAVLEKIVATLKQRSKTLEEMAGKAEFYFRDLPELDPESAAKLLDGDGPGVLRRWLELLAEPPASRGDFDALLSGLASERGVKPGAVAQPLRLALTGSTASPGLFEIIEIIGAEAVRKRIMAAIDHKA